MYVGLLSIFFEENGELKGLNATVLALVLKIDTPQKVSNFRPIACCNVVYKIISKILTNRIKYVLGKLVDINQSAFIPGRKITDNILLAQELLRVYNWKCGTPKCAMKIDLQKAYDLFLIPKSVMKEIERILKGFLWCGGILSKGKAKVAWEGLGLKNLQLWNEVLLTKHVWSICNKDDTLWVKWILTERLKGKSIWEIKDNMQTSWSWRSILKQRDIMRKHCIMKIGNGKNTSLLHDIWCSVSPLSKYINDRMLNEANLSDDVTVKDMIEDGRWKWPHEWINNFPSLGSISVPVCNDSNNDKLVWKNNNGIEVEFTVGNVWKDLREKGTKVDWGKVIWFNQCIPSHAFIMWLAMRDMLQTQDRLLKWFPTKSYLCTLCGIQHDSMNHLFFNCEYSEYIWNEMKGIMEDTNAPNNWKDVKRWFTNKESNNSVVSVVQRISLAACVYMIWKERNARVFDRSKVPKEKLKEQILEVIKCRLMSLQFKNNSAYMRLQQRWNL